jgi:hypothetical protein
MDAMAKRAFEGEYHFRLEQIANTCVLFDVEDMVLECE